MAKTNTKPFNHGLSKNTVERFDEAYTELKQFADEKGFKKPDKADYADAVLRAGLNVITPEDYFKDKA